MKSPSYIPNLSAGTEVRLLATGHARVGQRCKIIRILPNPSGRAEHQWYDVRFQDGSLGRFLEKYLSRMDANGENRAA
jgi:hypothetical protein